MKKTITLNYGDDAHLRPVARLLYLASDGSFDASASLESGNYLLGLKENTLFSSRLKPISHFPIDNLLTLAEKYIPPVVLKQYEAELRVLAGSQHTATNYSSEFPPPLPLHVFPPPSHSLPAPSPSTDSSSHELTRRNPNPPIPNVFTHPAPLSSLHRIAPQGRPTTHLQLIEKNRR